MSVCVCLSGVCVCVCVSVPMCVGNPALSGVCVCVLVTQSCPTLCDPTDSSLPGSAVHGILQARLLEWIAILFSRSFGPRD